MKYSDLITSNEIHLWQIYLSQDFSTEKALFETLSPDEQKRSEKFYFREDQQTFNVMHGAVREILSRYLECEPRQICFEYNKFGKPAIRYSDETANGSGVCFNISRSNQIAVCAVTLNCEIGVDIEHVREQSAILELAQRFFSPTETAFLYNIPERELTAAFIRCWTRKEAFIKVVGNGLSFPLKSFSVSPDKEKTAEIIFPNCLPKPRRFQLETFSPHPNYIAAVAIEGIEMPHINFRNWVKQTV